MLKPQRNALRELVSLDGFWEFRRDPEKIGEASGWAAGFATECELAVPGSWNEQRSDLTQFFGVGWYRKNFHAPAAWKNRGVRLHVGSAQRRARVWLNGQLVGSNRGAHLPFACPLSGGLMLGAVNLLVIEVDGSLDPWDLPPARLREGEERAGFHNSSPALTYDFFPYAGLPRSVTIEITPQNARFESIRVSSSVVPDGSAAVVEIHATYSGLADLPGALVASHLDGDLQSAGGPGSAGITLRHAVTRPRFWDVGRPELYSARLELRALGECVDCYEFTFGIRTVEVRGDDFLLNGRPVFFRGFGKHEDFAVVGNGFAPALVVRDFNLLDWVGANSFRTSHYPYAEEWYEFADRAGILVIGETPFVGLNPRMYQPEVLARARAVLQDMISRDQHHPSVVMWSLANEPDIDSAAGENFFRVLAADARHLDATRPVTYVAHREPENNAPLDCCDVVCLNKYYGWYEQPGHIEESLEEFGACLDRFRSRFQKPMLLAEFGADAVTGLHMEPAEMFSEEFQSNIIEAQYQEARRRPWVIGAHVWAFADFKTAQSITRVGMNRKGVFTRERQPKLAAHRLRALWAKERAEDISRSANPAKNFPL